MSRRVVAHFVFLVAVEFVVGVAAELVDIRSQEPSLGSCGSSPDRGLVQRLADEPSPQGTCARPFFLAECGGCFGKVSVGKVNRARISEGC